MSTYDFEIIIGTYEEFLLGYLCSVKDKEVKQSFASHDHTSSIRTVDHCGHYLASGAADDRIMIYDLKTRKACHMLVQHEATVNCLSFTNEHTHLISGSSDGVLSIVSVGNWQLEKKWEKAHKGETIHDIAIHPSGKLALTIGADTTLRSWNLVRGRQAYAINLNTKSKDAKSLEKIVCSPDGIHFILYGGKYTEIWNIEEGGITKIIEYEKKVTACIWLKREKILVGHENGDLTIVNTDDCTKIPKKAHDSRVKSLAKFGKWIVSASSNGEFKVWTFKLQELLKENTGCRPTCLKIIPTLKVKKEESSDEEVQNNQMTVIVNKRPKVIIEEDNEIKTEDEKVPRKKKKSKRKTSG